MPKYDGLGKEPKSYSSSKEQVAERQNLTETRRLDLQRKYYARQKQSMEHAMNLKIGRVRELLDQIALCSGNVSSEVFLSPEGTAPCFMYGERVESRRRYSKRMALLRFFLERRPKSPAELRSRTLGYRASGPQDCRSADEIFQEMLSQIESGSESDGDEEEFKDRQNDVVISSHSQSARPLCNSAVSDPGKTKATPVRTDKRRPKTAPSWQENNHAHPSLGVNSNLENSLSSIHKLASLSPQMNLVQEDGASSSTKNSSSSQHAVFIPFWADMDPLRMHSELRSLRTSQSLISSSPSLRKIAHNDLEQPVGSSTLQQPSSSSISSYHHKGRSVQQKQKMDRSMPRPKSTASSRRGLARDGASRVDHFFNTYRENSGTLPADDDLHKLPSLSAGRKGAHIPFKRASVYAPTIASRQRTLSSMLVTAGKRKNSVSTS